MRIAQSHTRVCDKLLLGGPRIHSTSSLNNSHGTSAVSAELTGQQAAAAHAARRQTRFTQRIAQASAERDMGSDQREQDSCVVVTAPDAVNATGGPAHPHRGHGYILDARFNERRRSKWIVMSCDGLSGADNMASEVPAAKRTRKGRASRNPKHSQDTAAVEAADNADAARDSNHAAAALLALDENSPPQGGQLQAARNPARGDISDLSDGQDYQVLALRRTLHSGFCEACRTFRHLQNPDCVVLPAGKRKRTALKEAGSREKAANNGPNHAAHADVGSNAQDAGRRKKGNSVGGEPKRRKQKLRKVAEIYSATPVVPGDRGVSVESIGRPSPAESAHLNVQPADTDAAGLGGNDDANAAIEAEAAPPKRRRC